MLFGCFSDVIMLQYVCFTDVFWMLKMKRINSYTLSQNQTFLITKIERFQDAFEATKFQRPTLVDSLKKTSIITSSGASTRIEGAILNDNQVQELINKGCKITQI